MTILDSPWAIAVVALAGIAVLAWLLGLRYIPHHRVGVIEKLWSRRGSLIEGRLISQTLDPILSAYFRDVAQSSNMLDLLSKREQIQARATEELGRRFREYDIRALRAAAAAETTGTGTTGAGAAGVMGREVERA